MLWYCNTGFLKFQVFFQGFCSKFQSFFG